MKIDGNLRQAIRSACNAQLDTNYNAIAARKTKAINEFLDSPKGKKAKQIYTKLRALYAECRTLEKDLCEGFGLRAGSNNPELANCGGGSDRYIKAGGKLPEEKEKWNFDRMMLRIAAATDKEAVGILKEIGIIWV